MSVYFNPRLNYIGTGPVVGNGGEYFLIIGESKEGFFLCKLENWLNGWDYIGEFE